MAEPYGSNALLDEGWRAPFPTLTGRDNALAPPRRGPEIGPRQAGLGERVSDWLASNGLMPRWQADRVGAVAPYTPWGGAFEAGQMIGQGIAERDPVTGGLGALAIFAGPMARTANKPMLARAQAMHAAGRSRDDIWNETGWFQGRDGQWRFEIDDSGLTVGTGNQTGITGGTVSHSELAAAYPELGDLPVAVENAGMGQGTAFYYPRSSPRGPSLTVRGYPEHHRGGVVHELQHAADDMEDRLGSPRYSSPAEAYQSIEEVMARNAQFRADLSVQQRRARPPWTTQGIPDDQQIVRRR